MQNIKLGEDCCSNETESELQLCVEPTVTESTDLEVAEFVLDRVYASVAERIELASVETENGSEEPVDAAETEETAQVDETAEVVDCTADTPVNPGGCFGLRNVQQIRECVRLNGQRKAVDDFYRFARESIAQPACDERLNLVHNFR